MAARLAPETGECIALLYGDARLALHDAEGRGPARQYIERGANKKYTCVAWSPGEALLGVGTTQGEMAVWDVKRGVRSAAGKRASDWKSSSGVEAIAFCSWGVRTQSNTRAGLTLIGCNSTESRLAVWQLESSQDAKVWCLKADKRGVSTLAASSTGILATVSTRVRLIRSTSPGQAPTEATLRRRTLEGLTHAEPVTALAWSQDGRFLASCGRDRTLLVYDSFSDTDQESLPVLALSLSAPVTSVSLRHSAHRLEIASVLGTESLVLQRIAYRGGKSNNSSSSTKKKQENGGTQDDSAGWLPVENASFSRAGENNLRVLDAGFIQTAKAGLVICLKEETSNERPVWRAFSVAEIEKSFEHGSLSLQDKQENHLTATLNENADKKSRKLPDILDPTPPVTAKRARVETTMEPLCELPELTAASGDEPVIGERLALLEEAADERESERLLRMQSTERNETNQSIGDANSLAVVLAQALKANDDRLIEQVLQHSESKLIERTVDRLAPAMSLPLLRAIARRLERRPSRGNQLAPWATQLLVTHASALARAPDLEAQLAPLDNLLAKRLDALPKLLALLGRFEFAFKRLRSDPSLPPQSSSQPAAVDVVLNDSLTVGAIPGRTNAEKKESMLAADDDDEEEDDDSDDDEGSDEESSEDGDDDDESEDDS